MPGVLLVGCGKMGGALLEGWRKNKAAERFVVIEPMEAAVAHLSGARRGLRSLVTCLPYRLISSRTPSSWQ